MNRFRLGDRVLFDLFGKETNGEVRGMFLNHKDKVHYHVRTESAIHDLWDREQQELRPAPPKGC